MSDSGSEYDSVSQTCILICEDEVPQSFSMSDKYLPPIALWVGLRSVNM